ncbi:FG-GAP-like repeat-containing protein [bacterium]|nr:FG-GAP-like repeat-containing protein [bacterium]
MAGAKKSSIWIILLLLIAASAAIAWYVQRPANDGENTPIDPKRQAELTELAQETTQGIAHLENHEWAEADAIFLKMAKAQPEEVLPVQNLAIARVMRLTSESSKLNPHEHVEEFANGLIAAHEAVEMLKARDSKSSLTGILQGELSMKLAGLPPSGQLGNLRQQYQGSYEDAFAHYEAAANADPENATAYFKMHDAAQINYQTKRRNKDDKDEALHAAGLAALEKAGDLLPENIWLLRTKLAAQGTAKDADILKTLQKTREVVAPIAERFQEIVGRDLLAEIDRAVTNAKSGKAQPARRVFNLLLGDIAARIDRRKINRNLLEFIAFNFSDEIQTDLDSLGQNAGDNSVQAIDVKFTQADTRLPKLDGASDVQLVDADLDTKLDVVVVRNGKVEIYGRDQSGAWSLIATSPDLGRVSKVVAADLDRDFDNTFEPTQSERSAIKNKQAVVPIDTDVDFVAYGPGGAFVLHNIRNKDGSRLLELTEQQDGIGALQDVRTAATVDVDHDGDLDLVFATADAVDFHINHGKFRFGSGNPYVSKLPANCTVTSITAVDWDRDVDTDLVCTTSDGTGVAIFENLTLGRFRFKRLEGMATDVAGSQAIVGDFDGNASWDVLRLPAPGPDDDPGLLLTRTSTTGAVDLLRSDASPGFQVNSNGLSFDYDNDGRIDLATWGGEQDEQSSIRIAHGTAGSFVDTPLLTQVAATACDAGDIDQDGDLDLAILNDDGITFLINEGGNANNSIDLTLRSEKNPDQFPSQRVNMHGIGSTIEMRAGARYQAMIVDRPVTHIGLGQNDGADILRIIWTDGAPENIVQPKAGVPILAQQDLKGSCPYLYTWNGSTFVFCTDCAWAAPIGLQQAEGKLMQPREWEYLKIRGDELKPKDSRYVLQMTEELWEAAYFDQIRLIAVDHPTGIDVFSNEKVGPASIAEYKIHTVKEARQPVAARDKHGNDILPLLSARDGNYHRGFDRRTTQGLAEDQILELELGDLKQITGDKPKSIRLFLTGWLMPTDTSLNIAISQNPDLQAPKPPAIQVPDKNGKWVETIPFCGFPGGKTKTIAIDITDAFLTDDYRLRLVTEMELKWDAAFFTVNEDPAEVQTHNLDLLSADLHFRGFSRLEHDTQNGPEKFHYNDVSTSPKWSPMIGRFTRYGDVASLLTASDDHMIVMGAGDEVTVEFDAGPPVPDGWRRDFLMYNVGWDKDADLNTVTGQSSEPYPFKSMNSYPPIDGETPDDDGYSEYLKNYQTREQEDWLFRNLIRHQPTKK